MPWAVKAAATSPATTMVATHPRKNFNRSVQLNTEFGLLSFRILALITSTIPIPVIAPVMTWVVETGNPYLEATMTVIAEVSSAQYPRELVILTSLTPSARMILNPYVASPKTIPSPPTTNIQIGTETLEAAHVHCQTP